MEKKKKLKIKKKKSDLQFGLEALERRRKGQHTNKSSQEMLEWMENQ